MNPIFDSVTNLRFFSVKSELMSVKLSCVIFQVEARRSLKEAKSQEEKKALVLVILDKLQEFINADVETSDLILFSDILWDETLLLDIPAISKQYNNILQTVTVKNVAVEEFLASPVN